MPDSVAFLRGMCTQCFYTDHSRLEKNNLNQLSVRVHARTSQGNGSFTSLGPYDQPRSETSKCIKGSWPWPMGSRRWYCLCHRHIQVNVKGREHSTLLARSLSLMIPSRCREKDPTGTRQETPAPVCGFRGFCLSQ